MRRRCILTLSLLLFLLFIGCSEEEGREPLLEVVCLDVGQGDATLFRTADGDILVDGGTESSQATLCNRLRELGVRSLRLMVLTHADEDHVGGADGILSEFDVKTLWINGSTETNESILRLYQEASIRGVPMEVVSAGKQEILGDAILTVLFPMDAIPEGNEGSIVLAVHCRGTVLLMMGDAGEQTESELLSAYGEAQLKADLLHVGHHGSGSSTGLDFLTVVQPSSAIISCGAGNAYGHPDGRTLARLQNTGAKIYRTDLLGEIVIGIDENGYWMIN